MSRTRSPKKLPDTPASALPDVLDRDLRVVFCASPSAHGLSRLLRDSGLDASVGFTSATDGLFEIARNLRPRVIAFVGDQAYGEVFGERPELGVQPRILADTGLFVLPDAAEPYAERLRWLVALREWLEEPVQERRAVRGLVLDSAGRTLLLRWPRPGGPPWWITPGGGVEPGETDEAALRRELAEELGLAIADPGPCIWTREFTFPWRTGWWHQRERYYLVRADAGALTGGEDTHSARWWTVDEIAQSDELFAPARLAELIRELAAGGPPPAPVDVGI